MNRLIWLILALGLLSACSTMTPARYSISVDNNQALKAHQGHSFRLASVTASGDYNPNCRLAGPIQAADGMTIPQFVEKAFNDELKFAELYSEDGTQLRGDLTTISFSSSKGLTNGNWALAMTLTSSNGASMDASVSYDFKSGFDAITACNQTAQALTPAVQDLINKIISDPRFASLIR